jgi:hypothetical protein
LSQKSLDSVLDLLKDLTSPELEIVRKHAIAYAGIGPKRRIPINEVREDWILDGILYELQRRGLGDTIPGEFFIRNKQSFAGYAERSERVRKMFDGYFSTTYDRLAFGRMLAHSLAKKVDEFAPISLDTLLRNVGLIPEAFDSAYPGYISNNMLPMLIKALHERRVGPE